MVDPHLGNPAAFLARILVVEDERNVGETLIERLLKEGFDAVLARSAQEARAHVATGRHFDLALLDVGLPDGNGFDVAQELRRKHPGMALIFLTAFASADHRIRGLELGAEDYVAKPFHLKELLLRVRNALKRGHSLNSSADVVLVGRAKVRFDRYEITVNESTQSLSQKECALLKLLVERRGQVVSRDDILNTVWSEEEFPTSRTVDNFIMRLRRLVEEKPEQPMVIKSIRGVGYQLL